MTKQSNTKPVAQRTSKVARRPKPEPEMDPASAKSQQAHADSSPSDTAETNATATLLPESRQSKSAMVLQLLQQPEGASIEELVAVTGWLPHTTRAALTGLKKKGHSLSSEKLDGVRRYHASVGVPA